MHVVTLDGPSKVGKTCIAKNMAEVLPDEFGPVAIGVAGDFYRKMTVACMDEVGPTPEPEELTDRLADVIGSELAFDEDRAWSDEELHSQAVDDLVSSVGEHLMAQDAAQQWYEITAQRAIESGKSTLIVDGRNPRTRLERSLSSPSLTLVLDLFVDCEVERAVQRNPAIPAKDRAAEILKLAERRRMDAERATNPMLPHDPLAIMLEPSTQEDYIHRVVESTHSSSKALTQVYFDTTEVHLRPVLTLTSALAITALQWYNQR